MTGRSVWTAAALLLLLTASPVRALEPREVFAKAAPSVVSIRVTLTSGKKGSGSGVALASDVVATNCHVVDKATDIRIRYAGKVEIGFLYARAPESDVCLVTSLADMGLRPATIAPLNTVQIGDRVYAIGAPLGLELTLSDGLISGFRESPRGRVIQTTAAISPGSSGGGLFDGNGALIGFTTFTLLESQNLNFAMPASAAVALLATARAAAANVAAAGAGPPSPVWASAPRVSPAGRPTVPAQRKQAPVAIPPASRSPPVAALPKAQEGELRDSIASAMSPPNAARIDGSAASLDYLRWLDLTQRELRPSIPEQRLRYDFAEVLWYESTRAGLEPALVLGVIEELSSFRKFYIATSGARGYMQVSPAWWTKIGQGDVGRLFQLQTNLRVGCVLLRHMVDRNGGDVHAALQAYWNEVSGPHSGGDNSAREFADRVIFARGRWARATAPTPAK